jgi:hypothetical protein
MMFRSLAPAKAVRFEFIMVMPKRKMARPPIKSRMWYTVMEWLPVL